MLIRYILGTLLVLCFHCHMWINEPSMQRLRPSLYTYFDDIRPESTTRSYLVHFNLINISLCVRREKLELSIGPKGVMFHLKAETESSIRNVVF
jgi:hypothetical protein